MRVYRRVPGGTYWMEFSDRDKRVRINTGYTTLEGAKEFARDSATRSRKLARHADPESAKPYTQESER